MATSRAFIVSDTSILLSFVCANKHDLLIKFAGPNRIYLPLVVVDEMERKLYGDSARLSCYVLLSASAISVAAR